LRGRVRVGVAQSCEIARSEHVDLSQDFATPSPNPSPQGGGEFAPRALYTDASWTFSRNFSSAASPSG
jgi:hypothetical protein